MSRIAFDPLSLAIPAVLGMLVIALLLAFVRIVRGPDLTDRVVALNLMSTLAVGIIAVHAIATQQAVYLDVASIVALISFLSTVAFSRYIELRKGSRR